MVPQALGFDMAFEFVRVFAGLTLFCGLFLTWMLWQGIRRFFKSTPRKIQKVKEPENQPAVNVPRIYTEQDLLVDLGDPEISPEEILKRAKDLEPVIVERVISEYGKKDRKSERLAWYAKMISAQGVLKVVPPPKPSAYVISVKASQEVCRTCVDHQKAFGQPRPYCKSCNGTGIVFIQRG